MEFSSIKKMLWGRKKMYSTHQCMEILVKSLQRICFLTAGVFTSQTPVHDDKVIPAAWLQQSFKIYIKWNFFNPRLRLIFICETHCYGVLDMQYTA